MDYAPVLLVGVLTPHQQREALARRDAGEPVTEIARSYDVHHATISRLLAHVDVTRGRPAERWWGEAYLGLFMVGHA
jgi:hypothetical protein